MEVKKKMNSQELRNLQEAYLEVVENQQLDEGESDRPLGVMHQFARGVKQKRGAKKDEGEGKYQRMQRAKKQNEKEADADAYRERQRVQTKGTWYKEQVDIYDIILSHLLDEGYAETPEAAESIMVNMSEEWRDSIVEEVISEGRRTSLSALSRESQARKADKERGRPETQDEKHRRLAMGRYSPSQYKWKKVDGQWKNMGRKDGEKD